MSTIATRSLQAKTDSKRQHVFRKMRRRLIHPPTAAKEQMSERVVPNCIPMLDLGSSGRERELIGERLRPVYLEVQLASVVQHAWRPRVQ